MCFKNKFYEENVNNIIYVTNALIVKYYLFFICRYIANTIIYYTYKNKIYKRNVHISILYYN